MPLGRAFPILLGAAVRFAPLCALRGTLGSASMTTSGGACTPRIALLQRLRNFPRARRTGFYRGVGAPTLGGSGPLSQIETFVTFCGMVGLRRGDYGRRSQVGWGGSYKPHPRAGALSCPSLAVYRAGRPRRS
jgi:hypothetical protein